MRVQAENGDTAEIILRLMDHLGGIWPVRQAMGASAVDMAEGDQTTRFIAAMELLHAQGYASYDGLVFADGAPRFENAALTPRGRVALEAIRLFQEITSGVQLVGSP